MNEIGSEFWLSGNYEKNVHFNSYRNIVYLLSGRTALDYIVKDIKAMKQFSSIAIPSYCCESVIEPFTKNGVEVVFYDVNPCNDGIEIDYNPFDDADAVLLLDYFGYMNPHLPQLAKQAKTAAKTVIYDATHKLNGNDATEAYADYSFCSFRKWFYSNAASVRKNFNHWNIATDSLQRNIQYESLRIQAERLKRDYVNGLTVDKSDFLSCFDEAERLLDHDYAGYVAEAESVNRLPSINITELTKKRQENAQRLIDCIKEINIHWLSVPIKGINADDCPMFVPLLIEPKIRATVKQLLIEQGIYCPVHWPMSDLHHKFDIDGYDQILYQSELSLICDQRYGIADIDRIIKALDTIKDKI